MPPAYFPTRLPVAKATGKATGHDKRRLRNALPQAFFCIGSDTNTIVGVMLIVRMCVVRASQITFAVLGGHCLLAQPLPIAAEDKLNKGIVFALKPEVEIRLRQALAVDGNTLNQHFTACNLKTWRCWPVQENILREFVGGRLEVLQMERGHVKILGVEPQTVESLRDILPDYHDGDAGGGALDAAHQQRDQQPRPTDRSQASEFRLSAESADRALAQLESVVVPRAAGTVTHEYRPEILLAAMQLKHLMKPSSTLQDVLSFAAPFFFGIENGAEIAAQLALRQAELPSDNVLRSGQIRLDLLALLWQRQLFNKNIVWRYLNVDASPQLGYNWLVLREDKFSFKKDETGNVDVVHANFNAAYSTRMCLLSVIGRGRASLVAKSFKLACIHKMESQDEAAEAELRSQVCGIVSDQGTESGCADISVMRVTVDGAGNTLIDDASSRQYPCALYMPDHLHVIYNALQSGVEGLSTYKHWMNRLRSIERFLSDKGMRRCFVATFLANHPESDKFRHYSTVVIDWRWEMLSVALDSLIPLFKVMKEVFDVNTFTHADEGKIDAAVVRECHEALHTKNFLPFCEMVRQAGKVLERTCHRLEGCECHRAIWMEKSNSKKKKRILETQTGFSHCHMKGRQGTWFQAKGLPALMQDIRGSTSDLLQQMMWEMEPADRCALVMTQTRLHESICAELADKLEFHNHCPYNIVRLFWGEITGEASDQDAAREQARQQIIDYDALVARGKLEKLHRVAHLVFGRGDCRCQLENFTNLAGTCLHDFPAAYAMVKRYALVPLTGRRVEAQHAQIKQMGRQAKNSKPPFISSAISAPAHLQQLRQDKGFYNFCVERWRSKTLTNDVLRLVVPSEELRGMTPHQKISRVYQCDMQAEFRDMKEEAACHKDWLKDTAFSRSKPIDLPPDVKACVLYMKAKLSHPGLIYSLPQDLFRQATERSDAPQNNEMAALECWDEGCAIMYQDQHADYQFPNAGETVFFEPINAYPERRFHVALHHRDRVNDKVEVMQRKFVVNSTGDRIVLMCDREGSLTISLLPLVKKMGQTLMSFFSWKTGGVGSTYTLRTFPEGLPALPGGNQRAMQADMSLTNHAAETQHEESCGSGGFSSAALALPVSDLQTSVAVERILLAAEQNGNPNVAFDSLEGVSWPDVTALSSVGALRVQADEFGGAEISVTESAFKLSSKFQIHSPTQVVWQSAYHGTCKMDLVFALLRDSWIPMERSLAPYKASVEKEFLCNSRRPNSYFVCLLQCSRLFDKGVVHVPHTWKDHLGIDDSLNLVPANSQGRGWLNSLEEAGLSLDRPLFIYYCV